MMKKVFAAVLALLVLLIPVLSAASSAPLGFGFVNAQDVALRRGPGGKALVRLPEGACVWIGGSETRDGVLWYEISAGLHADGMNVDYSGWMKAEFVDAGEAVWHGVTSLEASGHGIFALRGDGTAVAAGSVLPADASGAADLRRWSEGLRDVRQTGLRDYGWIFFALDGGGVIHFSDGSAGELGRNRLRLAGGRRLTVGITEDNRLVGDNLPLRWIRPERVGPEELSRVAAIAENYCRLLLLTADGRVFAAAWQEDADGQPEPDWENWTDVVSLDASVCSFTGGRNYTAAYAAVRADGTVLAAPAELASLIGGWTDMKKIAIAPSWILGLKRDGTVLCAGAGGAAPPDVSGWTGITDIAAGYDFCAGVTVGGTVVFAGEHVFMNEGHSRK